MRENDLSGLLSHWKKIYTTSKQISHQAVKAPESMQECRGGRRRQGGPQRSQVLSCVCKAAGDREGNGRSRRQRTAEVTIRPGGTQRLGADGIGRRGCC